MIAFVVLLLIFLSNFFGVKLGFVRVKNGQNSTRIESVEENDLRLNLDDEGADSFLEQNKPILKARKTKVKKNGQNSTRIKSVEETGLGLNLDDEGTDSFLEQNKPILKARKKKVKKNGQNSTSIKSVEDNGLKLNLDGEGTDSFLLKNYKPILNARKKKVKEVCQKYNLASGTIQNLANIYCTFQYKVRRFKLARVGFTFYKYAEVPNKWKCSISCFKKIHHTFNLSPNKYENFTYVST